METRPQQRTLSMSMKRRSANPSPECLCVRCMCESECEYAEIDVLIFHFRLIHQHTILEAIKFLCIQSIESQINKRHVDWHLIASPKMPEKLLFLIPSPLFRTNKWNSVGVCTVYPNNNNNNNSRTNNKLTRWKFINIKFMCGPLRSTSHKTYSPEIIVFHSHHVHALCVCVYGKFDWTINEPKIAGPFQFPN